THAVRNYAAALSLAAIAISYSLLSVFYFYEDFFKYMGDGVPMTSDRTGWMVLVAAPACWGGSELWTILSPWRLLGAGLAVAMLGFSAIGLWRGQPRARALSLITLWGVLLPQVLWYTEFLVDWHGGQGVCDAVMLALAICAVPTALLIRSGRPLADWSPTGSGRLLAFAVATAWIGFLASAFLDKSYQLTSWLAYSGALTALVLSVVAVKGIYHMRVWGLLAGIGAAVALAMVPLSASWTSYWHSGGYIDAFQAATAGSDLRVVMSMILPAALLTAIAAPFLGGFARKLRGAPTDRQLGQ
ncbi:MAG: hypothetical protein AAGC55_17140, partial [Myxococcota bacterium]